MTYTELPYEEFFKKFQHKFGTWELREDAEYNSWWLYSQLGCYRCQLPKHISSILYAAKFQGRKEIQEEMKELLGI